MTTEQTYEPMTEAEVQAFAVKTQAWWEQLTAREQALFRQVVRSAGAEGEDVQGYGDVEYAVGSLLFAGDPYPALRLAMSLLYPQPAPSVPSGPGGSTGGTLGTRTSLN